VTTRLANALQRHRHLKGARVLCQKNGQPLRANMLAYLLERATRKAGLPTLTSRGTRDRTSCDIMPTAGLCRALSITD
jgi:hypothetical protein